MRKASWARCALMLLAIGGMAGCAMRPAGPDAPTTYRAANLRPYTVGGQRYQPKVVTHYDEVGLASWYDYPAQSRQTASGEHFDARALTAAHKTLPLPCMVEVTDLENHRSIKVRVNDRGPFVAGRLIDLSLRAAERLGITRQGTARVRVRLIGPAPLADSGEIRLAQVAPDTSPDALGALDADLF